MKLNASKLVLAALATVIATGALTACQYGVDGKGGKTAAQKERHKCKGNNSCAGKK